MLRIIVLALIVQCVASYCDEGWEEYNGSCYGFSPEVLDWYVAAFACQLYDARLVQIDSQAKQDWIGSQLTARKITDAWAGGSNRYHNSKWEWVPSKRPFKSYTNWYAGEPNNSNSENPTITTNAEQCLHLMGYRNYKWNDKYCRMELNFVCEKRSGY